MRMETMTNDTTEQSYAVEPGASFALHTVSGSVSIQAGDEGTIAVRATKRGFDEARENTEIDIDAQSNHVDVHTRSRREGTFRHGKLASVDYVVTVPPGTAVEVKTVSANVRVAGTAARIGVQTVSGNVDLAHAEGETHVTTGSGEITATRLRGRLTLHSTS